MIHTGIKTGLLAGLAMVVGLSVPAVASVTQGWGHSQSLGPAPVEQQEAARDDVIQPPAADVDPDMTVTPPAHSGTIRIIPPPSTSGDPKPIQPR